MEIPANGVPAAAPGGFKIFNRIVDWITNDRMQLINITDRINEIVRKSGVRDGIVHLQSLHTTTAVFINEWQDALLHDVRDFLDELVCRENYFRHNDPEYSDCERRNADSHLRGHDDGPEPVPAGAQFGGAAGHLAEHHPGGVRRPPQPFHVDPGFRRLERRRPAIMPKRFTLAEAERLVPELKSCVKKPFR